MTSSIHPAELEFRDGVPFSTRFDDVYHSAQGALGQARHVFLSGNDLPARWAARRMFTVVETGFGVASNFLATWQAWRLAPGACRRLHFVSIEKHPFVASDWRRLAASMSADSPLAPLAAQLALAWPVTVAGLHRLEFEAGAVVLTLALGDVEDVLPKLVASADAFFLDGFSPAKNPAMWSDAMLRSIARLAAQDATCATYTVAGAVRRGLQNAGFEVWRAPGFSGKREMLLGRFKPRWRVRRYLPPVPAHAPRRDALVIGAGLAGCSVAERLAARGWRVTLLEQARTLASAASGNPAGVFHPLLSRSETPASRLARTGFLYAAHAWRALEERLGVSLLPAQPGLVQQTTEDWSPILSRLGWPAELVRALDARQAREQCGMDVGQACFFPDGGWLEPAALCQALLAAAAGALLETRFGVRVESLLHRDDRWQALDGEGRRIAEADIAVLANSGQVLDLLPPSAIQLEPVRGQLSYLPSQSVPSLRLPVIGDGYLSPCANGLVLGASFRPGVTALEPSLLEHEENLSRLTRLAPSHGAVPALDALQGRVAIRCATRDHLPCVGAMVDEAAIAADPQRFANAQLRALPRRPGLYGAFAYGSRGLVWAGIAAETLASLADGEPLPIERDLAEAIDPGRFVLRAARRQPDRR